MSRDRKVSPHLQPLSRERACPPEGGEGCRRRGEGLLLAGLRSLFLFRSVLADEAGSAWLAVVEALAEGHIAAAREAHARLFAALAEEAVFSPEPLVGDAWQNHLLDRLLADDNAFSRRARLAPEAAPDDAPFAAARHDLGILQRAHALAGDGLARALVGAQGGAGGVPSLAGLRSLARGPAERGPEARRLKARLASSDGWPALAEDLAAYYAAVGSGVFAGYRAFRWVGAADGRSGGLRGIAHTDPVTLDELVGYDVEREPAVRNVEHFLAGYPANNVLIYGDRGTGKSSTVKALLNAGADRGLRLIEVPKQHLADFPEIAALLRGRPERFVLFVDDLSFDEHETQYKELKAILEGGLEARPANVVLYATSNRRHLVQETFADRGSPGEEVHGQDAVQEKLSLSDRFGITVTFLAPDQGRYLAIVAALAERRGLGLPPEDLGRRALQWSAWHNGRSGRCARQFVDYLAGEVGLGVT